MVTWIKQATSERGCSQTSNSSGDTRESIPSPESVIFTALRSGSTNRGSTMTALLMRKHTPVRCNPDRVFEARGSISLATDTQQACPVLVKSPANKASAAVTVFYDGACPLCATEIGFYQRRRGAEKVAWVDARTCSKSILTPGLTRTDALRRFHVRDASGQWVSGGQAFATLWSALPTFSWFGRLFQIRGLAWLLDQFYDLFLRWRPHLQALARRRQTRKPS